MFATFYPASSSRLKLIFCEIAEKKELAGLIHGDHCRSRPKQPAVAVLERQAANRLTFLYSPPTTQEASQERGLVQRLAPLGIGTT